MKKEETAIQPQTEHTNGKELEVKKPSADLQIQQISVHNIDALETAEPAPIDLVSNYWTPVSPGESKRVIYDRIDITPVLSNDGSGEVIDLECAIFFVKENGTVKQICNGSKRLVGALQAYNIQRGTPLEITYQGKVRNKSNSFMSDSWNVRPLIVK